MNNPQNRLVGGMPKIGIRPVIDGRRKGVRESLEDYTMALANATLASMLRIPVYMHTVPEEQIFRPSAWTAFGTTDLEGADFRACRNF